MAAASFDAAAMFRFWRARVALGGGDPHAAADGSAEVAEDGDCRSRSGDSATLAFPFARSCAEYAG